MPRSMMLVSLLALAPIAACDRKPAAPSAPEAVVAAAPAGETDEEALKRAEAAAMELGKTLKGRRMGVMEAEGPVAAAKVCAEEAQELSKQVAEKTGVTVGRSSLRVRNPANAPQGFVREWLEGQGEKPVEGVTGLKRVADGRAQVIKPIAVETACVACHGARETLVPEVRAILDASYPEDRAVGYSPGDLRGALWAETSVRR
jgi:hypothetical protein